jgi:anti-sigma regulatory factor (Ser/Thr protein kinase)
VHAISEFVENAVEHGYTTEVSDGVVVEASLAGDGNLHASVIDRGQWKDYREGEQGRGRALAMAEAEVSRALVISRRLWDHLSRETISRAKERHSNRDVCVQSESTTHCSSHD